MERKNFLKNIKLHKLCNIDNYRPVFSYIHFENGYAYATNGRILCKARVETICTVDDVEMLEKLNGKDLYFRQYESLLKFDEITEITDEAITAKLDGYEVSFKFVNNIKFVNAAKIFDDFYKSKHTLLERVAICPDVFKLVGEVMPKCSALVFEFGERENAPMLVRYPNDHTDIDVKVIVMPSYLNE